MVTRTIALPRGNIEFFGTSEYSEKISANGLQHILQVSDRVLGKNATVIDIGANIGITSIAMAQYCPGGTVFALEPHPRTFNQLKTNVDINKSKISAIIKPINVGVSELSGTVKFRDEDRYNTGNSIIKDGSLFNSVYDTVDVSMVTGKDLFVSEGIESANLIKIDVEGFEIDVLKSLKDVMGICNCFIMEFNHWCLSMYRGILPSEALRYLRSNFNYVLYYKSGKFTRIETDSDAIGFLHENMVKSNVNDVLCTNNKELIVDL